jgi:hypothetical protein
MKGAPPKNAHQQNEDGSLSWRLQALGKELDLDAEYIVVHTL